MLISCFYYIDVALTVSNYTYITCVFRVQTEAPVIKRVSHLLSSFQAFVCNTVAKDSLYQLWCNLPLSTFMSCLVGTALKSYLLNE